MIVAACGGANNSGGSTRSTGGGGTAKKGGTIKIAIVVPTGAINPVTVGDQGGLCLLGQVGEFLTVADPTTLEMPAISPTAARPTQTPPSGRSSSRAASPSRTARR